LVRIALKGRVIDVAERPALNLVYLLDVSGSMNAPNKLPLVVRSMQALVNQLDGRDRVAVVVYAGAAGLVLPPTSGAEPEAIRAALERLQAGGSTDGAGGIELAYRVAREHFATGAVNRVILCTDGDFNVGTVQRGDLERLIEREAASGVFLTVLGFGMGNYKDSTLEVLSNKGNGNYAYIDDFREARKVLVDELLGTMVTIAKDVKIQVEFNPAVVAGYRLIGYENRMLKKEDFNNDRVDAGEIGAGHTVTAFYEIVPTGRPVPEAGAVDALKYQPVVGARIEPPANELETEALTVKLRYKEPDGEVSSKLAFPLAATALDRDEPSVDFRFASAVAGFGLLLRGPTPMEGFDWSQVLILAEGARGEDRLGHRAAFLDLVRTARAIAGE
jgi:Ca-activated chloride channel family protein